MSISGNFKREGPKNKLTSGVFRDSNSFDSETGERIDGICKYCKEWDAELVNGGCRDRECIDKRMDTKVKSGSAMRITSGVLNDQGQETTVAEHSGKRFIFTRGK